MKHSLTRLRRSLAATVAIGGAALLMGPAIAQIAAGTDIENTATATYEDPNNPGETIDATSNTVTIEIAEVAGITVVEDGVTDSTPGTNLFPGDTATFDFLITNTGNDTTLVDIPAPVITAPTGSTPGTVSYDIDADGDGTFETTGETDLAVVEATVLDPGGQIRVSVPIEISATAPSGADVIVQLGDEDGGQNEPLTGGGDPGADANTPDVATVDAADGTAGETAGAPINGEREASATNQTVVGAVPQAFATIFKVAGAVDDSTTPAVFNDDIITYELELEVEANAPAGSSTAVVPAALEGTPVSVDGVVSDLVLVSDAIPAGTSFEAGSAVAPAGWTVVYTTDATATQANDALWVTAEPASGITRVGFVFDASTTPVSPGDVVTGFQFGVVTDGLSPTDGGTVANVAQVFGETEGLDELVYDESGDQNPNNVNEDGTEGPGPDDGVADPASNGVDTDNDNSGTGEGGEDNVVVLSPAAGLLNGPEDAAGATGPTDNNDDFTNQSSPVPADTAPGDTIDPDPVDFVNTLQATDGVLEDVIIFPDEAFLDDPADLPDGTEVTLTLGTDTATYTYTAADGFILTDGSAIVVGTVPAGGEVSYDVTVDLPPGTPLSTDEAVEEGFPVPIVALNDEDNNAEIDPGEAVNVTIDRVYTGYLQLVKSAVVRDGTTDAVKDLDEAASGDFIDYTVTYTNIADENGGSGNVILEADNVVITEDGTLFDQTGAGNNWAGSTTNVPSTAVDSTGGTIEFFEGADGLTLGSDNTDVTKYVDNLTLPVAPAGTGTFDFTRVID